LAQPNHKEEFPGANRDWQPPHGKCHPQAGGTPQGALEKQPGLSGAKSRSRPKPWSTRCKFALTSKQKWGLSLVALMGIYLVLLFGILRSQFL
jgi:hypothetical protein